MSDEIKIDKGIPFPENRSKYPFDKLAVGESFFIKGKKSTQVSRFVWTANLSLKRKFSSRTVDGGVRIWRVA